MPTFTVKEIINARPWSKDGGEPTVVYYDFNAEEVPDRINVGRKPSNPLTVGMKLEGTLEDDQRGNGKRLKVAFGGGGGGRGRDPKESAQIIQQHSQRMALDWARLQFDRGKLPDDATLEHVLLIAAKFAADAKAAQP